MEPLELIIKSKDRAVGTRSVAGQPEYGWPTEGRSSGLCDSSSVGTAWCGKPTHLVSEVLRIRKKFFLLASVKAGKIRLFSIICPIISKSDSEEENRD